MGTTDKEHGISSSKKTKKTEPKKNKKSSGSSKKMSLTQWINSQLKDKGISASAAKKDAGKYKTISAAKKAGSLYYTNPQGTVKIAAFASDLDKMPKKSKNTAKQALEDYDKYDMRRSAEKAIKKSKEVGKSVMSDEQKKRGQKPSAKGMGQFQSPFQGTLGKKISDFFEKRNEGLKKDADKRKSSDIKEVNEFKKAKEAAEKKSRDFYSNLSKTPAFKNLPKKTQNMIKNLATGKISMSKEARDKQIKNLMKDGMNVGGLTQSPMMNGLSRKINPTTGLTMNKGGMIDYRKKGMFYGGGMARRGR